MKRSPEVLRRSTQFALKPASSFGGFHRIGDVDGALASKVACITFERSTI